MAVEQYDELDPLSKNIMKSMDFFTDLRGNLDRDGMLDGIRLIIMKEYTRGYNRGYGNAMKEGSQYER